MSRMMKLLALVALVVVPAVGYAASVYHHRHAACPVTADCPCAHK